MWYNAIMLKKKINGVVKLPNIGLVLSGGFAKGAYQVGVLKAVREFFGEQPLKYISASSIGVINAFVFCTGKIEAMEDVWRNVNFTSFRSFTKAYMRSSFITDTIDGVVLGQRVEKPALFATFLNLSKRKLDYIDLNNVDERHLRDFLLASVTLPVFSRAVEIDGMKYVDGALVDNIPVKPLLGVPLDYAVVVHFDNDSYMFENEEFDSKLIKINFMDERIVKSSLTFDQATISGMIQRGYEAAAETFEVVFKNGFDDVDEIRNKIRKINTNRDKKSFRLTGDVAVNNMNRVLKKIIGTGQNPKDNST